MKEMHTKPKGKDLAVAGFILSILGLGLSLWFTAVSTIIIAAGGNGCLMFAALFICILSIVLSIMGMSKLGKTDRKTGLAIAGFTIGIVSTIWATFWTLTSCLCQL